MVEVGRRGEKASPPKPILGSKRSSPGKQNQHQLRRWERLAVVLGREGQGNEPTQADARLVITGKEQNHRVRWRTCRNDRTGGVAMVVSQTCLPRWVGVA